MKHAFRWQIIVPRLLFVVVALMAAKYTVSRFVRAVAVGSLQSAVDANVKAHDAGLSLLSRRLTLSDVRFSSRSVPAHTVLQIDRCTFNLAATPLLYKQTIVPRGWLSGVRLDLPFSVTQQAPFDVDMSVDSRPTSTTALRWSGNDSADKARHWLATLDERYERELIDQFASVARADELSARWPAQASELDLRVRDLKRRAIELQKEIAAAQQNPLRNVEFFSQLPDEVATLRGEFSRADAELERLIQSVDSGRRKIELARRDDEQLVRKELQLPAIDAGSLTAYLLQEQMRAPLDQIIAVLRWIRHEIPAQSHATLHANRGADILFTGSAPTPGLLVQNLHVQGTARIGGNLIKLRGTLSDLSDAPSLHPNPIRLRMRSAGALPVDLQVTVDRKGELARDELLIGCRSIVLPKLTLGHADEFKLAVAPSVGTLSVDVVVEGERLSGDIQLVQKRVQMVPVFLGRLGDIPVAAALQDALANIDSLAMRVSLSGTLSEPRGALWSNVGTDVAKATEIALRRAGDQHVQALLSRAQKRVDEQLAGLDRMANERRAELHSQMATASGELKKIAGEHASDARISHGQLGRRLPAGSLFR